MCNAQKTTEEEYNWMVIGYKNIVVNGGGDIKKGYSFLDNKEYIESRKNYVFTYKFLQRDKDKTLAGIILVAKSGATDKTYYYGIPLGSWLGPVYQPSEFMPKFEADIYALDWGMYRYLVGTLANVFASMNVPKPQ